MMKLLKVLLPAALGAAIAFASPLVTYRVTKSKERRELIWKEEIKKFKALEERAGILTETLCGNRWLEGDRPEEVKRELRSLRMAAGRFRRYEPVKLSIRHLASVLETIYEKKSQFQSPEEEKQIRQKLEAAYKRLITTCDHTLHAD